MNNDIHDYPIGDKPKALSYYTNRENNLMKITSQCVGK